MTGIAEDFCVLEASQHPVRWVIQPVSIVLGAEMVTYNYSFSLAACRSLLHKHRRKKKPSEPGTANVALNCRGVEIHKWHIKHFSG